MQGKRVVVFVVGGITRSEMRVAHVLSKRLGREIVLGGTSLDDPATFLHNLYVRLSVLLRKQLGDKVAPKLLTREAVMSLDIGQLDLLFKQPPYCNLPIATSLLQPPYQIWFLFCLL